MPRNVIICIDGTFSVMAHSLDYAGSSCANFAFRWACENFLRPDDHVVLLHASKDFRNLEPIGGDANKKGQLVGLVAVMADVCRLGTRNHPRL
jgi:hypothetical protein